MPRLVRTVLGEVPPTHLGVTLMHEHVVPRPQVATPPGKSAYAPRVTLEDNIRELRYAARTYGLQSVVDCTPRRTAAELEDVACLASECGLNVVVATGCMKEQYYHAARGTVSSFWAIADRRRDCRGHGPGDPIGDQWHRDQGRHHQGRDVQGTDYTARGACAPRGRAGSPAHRMPHHHACDSRHDGPGAGGDLSAGGCRPRARGDRPLRPQRGADVPPGHCSARDDGWLRHNRQRAL